MVGRSSGMTEQVAEAGETLEMNDSTGSNAFLLAALHGSQAVAEFDLDGNILSANGNFLSLFGYEAAEVTGQHHRMFVAEGEADTPAYRDFWKKLGRGECDRGEYSAARATVGPFGYRRATTRCATVAGDRCGW